MASAHGGNADMSCGWLMPAAIVACRALYVAVSSRIRGRWPMAPAGLAYTGVSKMSLFSFRYSGVSAVTRGASTSRMNACFDSPARDSFNWALAA